MVKGYIYTMMELSMRESGLRINKMEMVQRYGQMVLDMKEIILMAKKKGKANFIGLMDQCMKENLKIIILMDLVCIDGQMVDNIKDNGKITK